MPGYNVFRKDRNEGRVGGVMIYVRNSLKCAQIVWPDNVTLECVGVNIVLSKEMNFIVICIYRKPSTNVEFFDQLKLLLDFCCPNKEIILIGDFNINWDSKKERKNLKQITDLFNMVQLIDKPTRITNTSKTRIDLLFTNKTERILKTYHFLTGLSDHNAIFFTRKLTKAHFQKSRTSEQSPSCFYDIVPKGQLQNLSKALMETDWNEIVSCDNISTNSVTFHTKVLEAIVAHTKRIKKNKTNKCDLPWPSEECRELMRTRDQLLKKSLKTELNSDRQLFTSARNKVVQVMRKTKANFI